MTPLSGETIAERYRRHADAFESKVAAVTDPAVWDRPSPCAEWTAGDVVGHIVDMHGVMLRPFGRPLTPGGDPLTAFRFARAAVEEVLRDPALAGTTVETPMGKVTAAQHIDQVVSEDMVLHGWDLARATGQDDTMDPADVDRIHAATAAIPAEDMALLRTPDAFGPGVVVFGPEVSVPHDAPLQDRLLGLIGRDPSWLPA
ncbi:TIGR03086 family protein [Streptomyces bambusae]|uniref:TIGR03086 family metal-binding protein n=1 Tax=Streptomyces bambusae TaxID=1550616 RepID=UPI001CFD514F|nr:TIGR03086 family metal-binding protein [Streptomyces bambusae]MCB5165214.1 TIGR03086 family protein [Streptomyces bambusae]